MFYHVKKSNKRVVPQAISTTSMNITKILLNVKEVSCISKRERKFNKAIVVSTVIYILMTLPSALASFYFNEWWDTDIGNLIINICDDLTLSYHGFVFFVVYVVNNRRYRCQLKQMYTSTKEKINKKIKDSSVNTFIISYLFRPKKCENKEENVAGSV